eukprot:gene10771-10927_t
MTVLPVAAVRKHDRNHGGAWPQLVPRRWGAQGSSSQQGSGSATGASPPHGGHNLLVLVRGVGNYLQLGSTLDDALGEAYDKVARMLGLELKPNGGAALEVIARQGNPHAYPFAVPMKKYGNCDFSYAGLKTSVRLCIEKVLGSAEGVADAAGLQLVFPPPRWCTDNGVMVGWAGIERYRLGLFQPPAAALPEDGTPEWIELRPRWPLTSSKHHKSMPPMLDVDKSASQADIKKAYYKLALQWHPDRNKSTEATARFQALQRIYDVLSDPEKRKIYDRTGSLQDCEELVQGDDFQDLYAAFRAATRVTEEDIKSFAVTYRGSDEERRDLLQFYLRFKGDMAKVFNYLMLSRPELDSHRFRNVLEAAIAAGELKASRAYKQWADRVAATPAPTLDPLAPPATREGQGKKKVVQGDDLALVAAIKGKGQLGLTAANVAAERSRQQPHAMENTHQMSREGILEKLQQEMSFPTKQSLLVAVTGLKRNRNRGTGQHARKAAG